MTTVVDVSITIWYPDKPQIERIGGMGTIEEVEERVESLHRQTGQRVSALYYNVPRRRWHTYNAMGAE